jgi:hypothetical protein
VCESHSGIFANDDDDAIDYAGRIAAPERRDRWKLSHVWAHLPDVNLLPVDGPGSPATRPPRASNLEHDGRAPGAAGV